MAIEFKEINTLSQKSAIEGTEKLPVSDTEYITPNQLAEFSGDPNITNSAIPTATNEGALVNSIAGVGIVSEFTVDNERFDIETYVNDDILYLTRGRYGIGYDTGTYLSSQSGNRHAIIYMEPGDYIQITPASGKQCWMAFVKNFNIPVADGNIPFAGNSKVNQIEVGDTAIFKAPDETVGVRIFLGAEDTWDFKPSKVVVYRDKVKLKMELLKGNGRREVLLAPINYANHITGDNGYCYRVRKGYNYCINTEFENNGTGVTKYLTLSLNVPQNYGYNEYTWTPTTDATIGSGSNYLEFENWGNWEENYQKVVNQDCTWGFITILSANANSKFTNVKVYEIDPYSTASSWSRIVDPELKGLAKGLGYNEVNINEATQYSYQISAPMDQYGTSSTSKRIMIPVTNGQFVKIIYEPEKSRSVREFAWFTENVSSGSKLRPPLVEGTGAFSSSSIATEYDSGDEFYLQVPYGAKYLSIYLGNTSSYEYAPFYVGVSASGIGGGASSSDQKADNSNRIVAQRITTEGYLYGLTPIDAIETDANGWEIPQTVQQLNAIKKALQCISIKWTPKKTIVGKNKTFTANVEQTSIPYSSPFQKEKYVGLDVSFHTFMTAVNNQYSLLYTEKVSADTSTSAWGETYYGGNGPLYYALVCCSFTSFVSGQPTIYNNTDYPRAAALFNIFCSVLNRKDVNCLKIGDIGDNAYHSFLIYGIQRNASGEIIKIKIAESTSASGFDGCRIREFTPSDFYTYLDSREGSPFQIYRITNYYPNIYYEPSPYVPLTDYGETITTITYNNDICCFAGDKAEFMEGDRIAINYNLTASPSHTWTAIEVYKDNTLYNTYTLANIDQTALDESQKNHALDLGTTLPYGSYKARMTDGTNYSDYTYWEVLQDTFSIINNQDGSWTFSADESVPIKFLWLGSMNGSFVSKFGRELDWKEIETNSLRIYIDKTMKDWGREDPATEGTHVRFLVKGQYGTALKVMPIPGRS